MKKQRKKFSIDELGDLNESISNSNDLNLRQAFNEFIKSGMSFCVMVREGYLPTPPKRGKKRLDGRDRKFIPQIGKYEIAEKKFELGLRELNKALQAKEISFITLTELKNNMYESAKKIAKFIIQS